MKMHFNEYAKRIHKLNEKWWHDFEGKPLDRNGGELLMLVITELAEGVEGLRKNLMDDHLPHRKMIEVELADAMIRLFDFAGGFSYELLGEIPVIIYETNEAEIILNACHYVFDIYTSLTHGDCAGYDIDFAISYILKYAEQFGYDVWGALEEKLEYNQKRADHKIENRMKENGKKF